MYRLKKLVRSALSHSPFYAELYQNHGISLRNLGETSLSDFPTIEKIQLMDNYDLFICDGSLRKAELEKFIDDPATRGRYFKGKYTVIHTSGSSGTIGIFVYGPKDWAQAKAIALSRVSRVKVIPFRKSKYAFIGATEGHFAAISMSQEARSVMHFLPLSINEPMDWICREINRFQPSFVMGYASAINLLAQEQLEGRINVRPRRIVCSGDSMTNGIRDNIRSAFRVEPYNFYGTSEAIGMAIDCEQGHRLHIFEDWIIIEVLDKNLKPVKEGEPGQVYLTNLYNYTQPLIRYRMSDEIVLSNRSCECGSPFKAIEKIAGRQEDFLWFRRRDGSKEFIHPIVLAEFFVPGLVTFQFVQPEPNKLVVRAVVKGEREAMSSAIKNRVKEILARKGLEATVSLGVEIVDRIEIDKKTGKFRLVVPI